TRTTWTTSMFATRTPAVSTSPWSDVSRAADAQKSCVMPSENACGLVPVKQPVPFPISPIPARLPKSKGHCHPCNPTCAMTARTQRIVRAGAVAHVRIAENQRRLGGQPMSNAKAEHVGGVVDGTRARVAWRRIGVRPAEHHIISGTQLLQRRHVVSVALPLVEL